MEETDMNMTAHHTWTVVRSSADRDLVACREHGPARRDAGLDGLTNCKNMEPATSFDILEHGGLNGH
jgi:hypothetical protein